MRCSLLLLILAATPVLAAVEDDLHLGPVTARLERGPTLYLALERGGVAVVDTSTAPPSLVAKLHEARAFSRLVLDGDTLLAIEVRHEVTMIPLGAAVDVPRASGPSRVVEPAAPAPVQRQARVTAVIDGRLLFAGGPEDGFEKGRRVRVISQRLERKPDLATGQPIDAPSGEVTAVLDIEEAQPGRAMAVLGRGDFAEVGDLVELTSLPLSEKLLAPRRAPFRFRTGFVLRPFLGLEGSTKPFGLLIDGYVQWYLPKVPVVLSLSVAPFGFAVGSRESHYPGVVAFTAAYTTDYFEIGLGAGALWGNRGPCVPFAECEVNSGVTINQVLRLGSLDGLHLEWHSSIFARAQSWVFGVGRGEIAVPLSSRLGLFAAGGAGENGWGMGEFGIRTAIGGAGGRGTVILSASLGASGIFDGPSREMVLGPAVSFGSEWRL